MATQKNSSRISAIIPAYNEAARIGSVLSVISSYPHFHEVIVIDDGSTDGTEQVVKQFPVRYIRNTERLGKGGALDRAISQSSGDILFFCDADIRGLTHDIIEAVIAPVVRGEHDMFIAMRNRKIYWLHFILAFIPLLGGERALRRGVWENVPASCKEGFRIETAMNFYARYYGKGFSFRVFSGLSQTIKEKKYGLLVGLRHRYRLFADVIGTQWRLQWLEIPRTIRNQRLVLFQLLGSSLGVGIGLLFLVAAYIGGREFITSVFAQELFQKSEPFFAQTLLYMVTIAGDRILSFLGLLIFCTNLLFFFVLFRKAYFLGCFNVSWRFRAVQASKEEYIKVIDE